MPATNVVTTNAIHRKTRMMKCGMARNHFTSHSPRLSGSSSVACEPHRRAAGDGSGSTGTTRPTAVVRPPRVAKMINAAAPPSSTSEPIPRPIINPTRALTLTPTDTSAATPALPSGFITTIDQLPPCTSQVSVCTPAPPALATQNVWSVGGAGVAGAVDAAVLDVVVAVRPVDVGHLIMGDAREVGLDVAGVGDPDEDLLALARRRSEPDGGQITVAERPPTGRSSLPRSMLSECDRRVTVSTRTRCDVK